MHGKQQLYIKHNNMKVKKMKKKVMNNQVILVNKNIINNIMMKEWVNHNLIKMVVKSYKVQVKENKMMKQIKMKY